ncbi:MAG: amidohydrolase family protein [Bacteroides sp.]|nr:amidohydrolase family protein [Bacteroides sp.]
MKIIDAHSHLWLSQDTMVEGLPIYTTANGRSMFLGEEKQMLPPFMIDGRNSAEVFLSNMDYAQVSAAVVVQEFIDGNQNDYLREVKRQHPNRFFVFGFCDYRKSGYLEEARRLIDDDTFGGMAIPAHRMIGSDGRISLNSDEMMQMFRYMEQRKKILSICLADDDIQLGEMEEIIQECPTLKVAVGHLGMATTPGWRKQIELALHPQVFIEAGGITWLYHDEFYPYPGAVRAIRQAADWVGMDKLMWGSDYPRTITAITYRMSYDFVLRSDELTEAEKELFMYQNAQSFYGFRHLVSLPYIRNMSE